MKTLRLPKERLDEFATVLQQFGELHAPVKVNGQHAFRKLSSWSEVCQEYTRTILPPKKYFRRASVRPLHLLFCTRDTS